MAGMNEKTAKRRRWFQFRLRTLFVLVAVGALLCWGYWIGWPWFVSYREQLMWMDSAVQVRAGMTFREAVEKSGEAKTGHYSDSRFNYGLPYRQANFLDWPGVEYCICYTRDLTWGPDLPLERIEIFRLSLPVAWYAHFHKKSRGPEDSVRYAPAADHEAFADFVFGDRKNDPGFKYELIYSDPPR